MYFGLETSFRSIFASSTNVNKFILSFLKIKH